MGPGCEVVAGFWTSPYDGMSSTRPADFDIDHVVSLSDAHRSGGWRWDAGTRRSYANDPDVLLTTSATSNRSKGDKTPDQWRPNNQDYWCAYATKWVSIKLKYTLTITTGERDALGQMLETCTTAGPTTRTESPSATTTATPPGPPNNSATYKNCAEARAAGAAPVHRGQPGYGTHLDRDGDGIGCE